MALLSLVLLFSISAVILILSSALSMFARSFPFLSFPSSLSPPQSGEPSLMDNYEYVMHGKVFKVSASKADGKLEIFTSYGGLLMSLKGEPNHLKKIELDMRMYLLIKKVDA